MVCVGVGAAEGKVSAAEGGAERLQGRPRAPAEQQHEDAQVEKKKRKKERKKRGIIRFY